MLRALFALALLLIPPAALAQSKMTPDEAKAVQLALDRGTLLYYYDQAAWHGTDDMLAKIGKRQNEIGGWIVDGPANAAELLFYDKNAADPRAVYVATFAGTKLVSGRVLGPGDDRTISPARKRLIAAVAAGRAAFERSDASRCVERSFNTVVLPPETLGGASLVYFLTPQTETKVIPFGGHYSFAIAADGTAGPMRRFTKSCIALQTDTKKDGKSPEGLVISHLLDPTPTEIHVFSMLAARKTVYVITTDGRLWFVGIEGGKLMIRLVDTEKQGSKK